MDTAAHAHRRTAEQEAVRRTRLFANHIDWYDHREAAGTAA
jgi:hypothetical protein